MKDKFFKSLLGLVLISLNCNCFGDDTKLIDLDKSFVNYLKIKKTNHSKIRIGPNCDGGYVVSDELCKNVSALFNYGVGFDTRFEEDFRSRYLKPVYLFDHTLGWKTHQIAEGLNFFDEGLGFSYKCRDVIDHYAKLGIEGTILLKIDVEGAEYDYFKFADIDKLSSFTDGIIIEIHWLSNPQIRSQCVDLLSKLSRYFTLIHVHGNNYGSLFSCEGYAIPDVMELLLVNKRLVDQEHDDFSSYPVSGLDYPNNINKNDLVLEFTKKN